MTKKGSSGAGWRWEISSGLESVFRELISLFESPLSSSHFTLVKEEENIKVYALKLEENFPFSELWLKVAFYSNPIESLFTSLRNGGLQKIWRCVHRLAPHSTMFPRFIAYGERKKGIFLIEERLVLESLSNYRTFDQYFQEAFRTPTPSKKLEEKKTNINLLAQFFWELHNRGLCLKEYSPTSLLVGKKKEGSQLRFLCSNPSLLKGFSRDNQLEHYKALARFIANFESYLGPKFLIRFFHYYFSEEKDKNEFQKTLKGLIEKARNYNFKRLNQLEKDIYLRKFPFYWFRCQGYRIFFKGLIYQNQLVCALKDIDLLARQREPLKLRNLESNEELDSIVRSIEPTVQSKEKKISPARKAFFMSARLSVLRIPHIPVVSAVEDFHKAEANPSYQIIAFPSRHILSLAEYLAGKVAEEISGFSWDRKVLFNLGCFLARIHWLGLYYPDARPDDFCVEEQSQAYVEFLLSNLDHLELTKELSLEQAVNSLSSLCSVLPLSESDGMIIVEHYVSNSSDFRSQKREFLKMFKERSRRWLLH